MADGEVIALVPLSEAHTLDLDELAKDADVLRFTRIPTPVPPGFARTWLDAYETGRRDGSKEAFVIAGASGAFLGLAVAPRIDRAARTAELGYTVVPAARGRGIATAALRLLTEWAFRELAAIRLELMITAVNDASKKVAVRSGYTREGVLRSLYVKPGVREDTEIWSRLSTDA